MATSRLPLLVASSALLLAACGGMGTQTSGGMDAAAGSTSRGSGASTSGSTRLGGTTQGSSSIHSGVTSGSLASSSSASSGASGSSGSSGGTTQSSSSSGSSGSSGADGGAADSGSSSDSGVDSGVDSGPPTLGSTCSGTSTVLTGTVYAPNGIDPIPNVRVYAAISIEAYPAGYCDKCSAPVDPSYVATRTASDGTYSLDLDSVPAGASITFAIQIGRFRKWTVLPVTACQTTAVPIAADTLPGASGANANIPSIAVSAGNTDHLDSVLTTLGITEFDCYEGRDKPFYPYGGSCALSATSPNIAQALTDSTKFGANGSYNMAFISCAPGAYAHYVAPITANPPGLGYSQATMTSNTQAWVAAGGRLFVTDTSYDYVSQAFPAYVTWAGAAGTPQPVDGANIGCAPAGAGGSSAHGVLYPITVDDPTLAAWLQLPAVGFPTSPNVSVDGFYEPWSTMSSLSTNATLIANGPMMPLDPTLTGGACTTAGTQTENVPLTAEFDVPTCGRVLFSSYHTYTGTGTGGTAANEKIMEFLIFAAANCHQ